MGELGSANVLKDKGDVIGIAQISKQRHRVQKFKFLVGHAMPCKQFLVAAESFEQLLPLCSGPAPYKISPVSVAYQMVDLLYNRVKRRFPSGGAILTSHRPPR
jgi:hypothetical protein